MTAYTALGARPFPSVSRVATVATPSSTRGSSMETIPHRELRNNSSEVLARVAAGETIAITNHGTVVAIMCPPAMSVIERLTLSGGVRPPRRTDIDFTTQRRSTNVTYQELMDDRYGE